MMMTFAPTHPRLVALISALALISGGLLALAYSNNPAWWAAWLAPAPALAAVLLTPPKWRRHVGLAVGLLAGMLSFNYRVETGSFMAAVVITAAYAFG